MGGPKIGLSVEMQSRTLGFGLIVRFSSFEPVIAVIGPFVIRVEFRF